MEIRNKILLVILFFVALSYLACGQTKKVVSQKTKSDDKKVATENKKPSNLEIKNWIVDKLNRYVKNMEYTQYWEDKTGKYSLFVQQSNFRFEQNILVYDFKEIETKTFYNKDCENVTISNGKMMIDIKYFKSLVSTDLGYINKLNKFENFPALGISTDANNIKLIYKQEKQALNCDKWSDEINKAVSQASIYVNPDSELDLGTRLTKAFKDLNSNIATKGDLY